MGFYTGLRRPGRLTARPGSSARDLPRSASAPLVSQAPSNSGLRALRAVEHQLGRLIDVLFDAVVRPPALLVVREQEGRGTLSAHPRQEVTRFGTI
jgi:hypothetical protein